MIASNVELISFWNINMYFGGNWRVWYDLHFWSNGGETKRPDNSLTWSCKTVLVVSNLKYFEIYGLSESNLHAVIFVMNFAMFPNCRQISLRILTHYSQVLLFYTPWKHQKIFRFSDDFRGYRNATPGSNRLSEFKRINEVLFLLESSENHRLSDNFKGNRK